MKRSRQPCVRWRASAGFAILVVALVSAFAARASADEPPAAGKLVARDVAYASSSAQQTLDVYAGTSPGRQTSPAVVLVHGGGWTSGDKATFAGVATALASRGFVVFNINYRLGATSVPAYRGQVDDVRRALDWVRANAGTYGGDGSRIGLLGGSAGAYLAAMVATTAGPPEVSGVRAAVSLSGPMDITTLVDYLRDARRDLGPNCSGARCNDLAIGINSLHTLLGCDPFKCPPSVLANASPITHASATSPPFFLANSHAEGVPASQARGMARALTRLGVPVELRILPGQQHALEYLDVIGAAGLRFLEDHLAPPTPRADSPAPDVERASPWRRVAVALVVGLAAIGVLSGWRRVFGHAR